MQAGVFQSAGQRREQHAVGRQRQVVNPGQSRETLDERRQILIEQRLAARQANLADAEPGSDAGHSQYFLVGQPLLLLQELVVGMELVLRHAVRAAKIALIEQ